MDSLKGIEIFRHPYVFLAIEFGNEFNGGETKVLGVYTNRETAEAKVHKTAKTTGHSPAALRNYGVIKKTIEGRRF